MPGKMTTDTHVEQELVQLRARIETLEATQQGLEAQIRHLHRAKTLADLLTGIAHDLTGSLTGVLWCSEALRRRAGGLDADLSAGLVDFIAAAEYARKLARRLISIGRQRHHGFRVVSLDPTVREALAMLDALRPKGSRLVFEGHAPHATVWGDPESLQQLLVNLVTNAFDAIPEAGGQVRVSLTNASDDPGWFVLRVWDNGRGMDPATLSRAFEPFFTTKGGFQGNGLGLVIARSIAERHGGTLSAESEVSRGTSMSVLLPSHVQT